jgi:hypothetical protein
VVEDLTAPLTPVVEDLTAPLTPVVEELTAPLTPVVEDLTAPLTPVVEDLTAPLAPAVEDLTPASPIGLGGDADPTPALSPAQGTALPSPAATPSAPAPPVNLMPADTRSPLGLESPHATGGQSSPAAAAPGASILTSPGLLEPALPTSPTAAAAPSDSTSGPVPPNGLPAPAPSGASAGSGAAGVASSVLFALLLSLAAFGLRHFTRLRLASFAWRPQAFVAVIERPG